MSDIKKSKPKQIISYYYTDDDDKKHIPYKILVEMTQGDITHPSSIEYFRKSEGLTHSNFRSLKYKNQYLERELKRLEKELKNFNEYKKKFEEYEKEINKLKAKLYDLQNKE